MSRRLRGAGNARGMRGGGRGGGGIVVAPPALEVPLQIPGLMAWFDSRDPAYFALGGGGEVNAWMSCAGSLGPIAWQQGTAANQPIRAPVEPLFNNLPAVLFDGVNDWLDANSATAGVRLHNGLGGSTFRIFRLDSTGGASQKILGSANTATEIGISQTLSTANMGLLVANGSGTFVSNWTLSTAAHIARDVSRWQMWGYVAGTSHSRVSGSNLTFADAAGPPSTSPPTRILRLGAASNGSLAVKGLLPQELHYDHVLTAGETTQLAAWAASTYGVAA
jgi:hypothetical protein